MRLEKLPEHITAHVDLDSNVLRQSIVLRDKGNGQCWFISAHPSEEELRYAVNRLTNGTAMCEADILSKYIGKQIVF